MLQQTEHANFATQLAPVAPLPTISNASPAPLDSISMEMAVTIVDHTAKIAAYMLLVILVLLGHIRHQWGSAWFVLMDVRRVGGIIRI